MCISSYENYYGISIFYALISINTFWTVNSLVYILRSSVFFVEIPNIVFHLFKVEVNIYFA